MLKSRWSRAWLVLSLLWVLPVGFLVSDEGITGIKRLATPRMDVTRCKQVRATELKCDQPNISKSDLPEWLLEKHNWTWMEIPEFESARRFACDDYHLSMLCEYEAPIDLAERQIRFKKTIELAALVFGPPLLLYILGIAFRWVWIGNRRQ